MRSAILISFTFIVAVTSTALNANSEISCESVRTPDLQNSKISDMNFKLGKAFTSDGLYTEDWEHEILSDRILKPSPQKEIRLIVINSNHLTGSGAWDTVIAFDCVQGTLKEIFKIKYLYGVRIETRNDNELVLTSGDWQHNDPMCCPSKEKREIYRWNDNKGTYILEKKHDTEKNKHG